MIRIINDDFLKTDRIAKNSIDLTVTSPPYNVGIDYDQYEDLREYEVYLEWVKAWMNKLLDVTVETGRFCLNVPLNKNYGQIENTFCDFSNCAKEVGWNFRTAIIWNKNNISKRTAWGSWLSATAPSVIAQVEMILVFYKGEWKRSKEGKTSTIQRDDFISWTNGTWVMGTEKASKIGHPAPFPVELPRRCIELYSFKEDTVFDPFLGSGTTLLACMETGRSGVGVEISEEYCEIATKRIEEKENEQP